jgi:hypothetical protein
VTTGAGYLMESAAPAKTMPNEG